MFKRWVVMACSLVLLILGVIAAYQSIIILTTIPEYLIWGIISLGLAVLAVGFAVYFGLYFWRKLK